ncbi:hypothetical protein M5X00_23265 [Paenibacillus alvei]|uniref:Terminase small subunit n=1 Tax=Paenibacillus alvei TaxID=44250 RepID=A0ABT4H7L6_PAEAL|nr:hypothetical protein [Paenibacillus alvei]EJW14325.1 hypothetical protein PAV_14c00180 [Paenibacillus alvei DSM 29]MCY9541877.1 hypothetical protein [Paenibacillus alvei]MCY9737302.1 hypothetical protein [Paenibacillus alvei]MCY9757162.1 hypothetical protein [Paenibacillus alvei]MCY9764965.1 hypothetical protein [Paenibacillus alvei]
MSKSKKLLKQIGDTTSFTIPDEYVDIKTGEKSPVRPEMIAFINEHLNNRNLVHALMTCIDSYIDSGKRAAQHQTIAGEDSILNRIESKLDDLKSKLQSGHFNISSQPESEISADELTDLLNEYTL